jgi:hypothetical protein
MLVMCYSAIRHHSFIIYYYVGQKFRLAYQLSIAEKFSGMSIRQCNKGHHNILSYMQSLTEDKKFV